MPTAKQRVRMVLLLGSGVYRQDSLSTFATFSSWDRSRVHAIKFNIRDFKSGFSLGPRARMPSLDRHRILANRGQENRRPALPPAVLARRMAKQLLNYGGFGISLHGSNPNPLMSALGHVWTAPPWQELSDAAAASSCPRQFLQNFKTPSLPGLTSLNRSGFDATSL
jgi:hypothetical protein